MQKAGFLTTRLNYLGMPYILSHFSDQFFRGMLLIELLVDKKTVSSFADQRKTRLVTDEHISQSLKYNGVLVVFFILEKVKCVALRTLMSINYGLQTPIKINRCIFITPLPRIIFSFLQEATVAQRSRFPAI